MGYNILVFIPLGVYAGMLATKRKYGVVLELIPAFILSLLYEVIQYFFAIGASDITDVIGNTLGGAVDVCLWILLRKLFQKNAATVVNVIGLVVEVLAIALITVVTVANW